MALCRITHCGEQVRRSGTACERCRSSKTPVAYRVVGDRVIPQYADDDVRKTKATKGQKR